MSFAKVVITGTLTGEPEKRFTPNNHAVTSFTLAVENMGNTNRPGANEPFFIRVTCWRNLAEAVSTQLNKGDHVLVEGKLMMNSFQAQDGTQKKLFEVEATTLEKLPGKPEALVVAAERSGAGTQGPSDYAASGPSSYDAMPGPAPSIPVGGGNHFSSEDLLTEDDIPF